MGEGFLIDGLFTNAASFFFIFNMAESWNNVSKLDKETRYIFPKYFVIFLKTKIRRIDFVFLMKNDKKRIYNT